MFNSKIPNMELWLEATIDFGNRVSIPGCTLKICRRESMSGQHIIVVTGGKKGVKRVYHDLHTGVLNNSFRLPFKILDRFGIDNSDSAER